MRNRLDIDQLTRRCAVVSRRRALGLMAAAVAGVVVTTVSRQGGGVGAQVVTDEATGEATATPEPTSAAAPGARPPAVPAIPAGYCTQFVLSGGASPVDPIHIDDDLTVYLNDLPIFRDQDGGANLLTPISFQATPGDQLTVVARDMQPCGRKLGPLWLHCGQGGGPRQLTAGLDPGCDPDQTAPDNFFRETWVI